MLTSIKIAGFKSFAEPISLNINDRLIGVVGPNGCGKSNVADALRWVLGEGSAKSLRADTMGEVIFAGTRERKSLSRADVELVFDNQKGLFGGEFARYSEVSVRREVFSEGHSRYYLNGTLCRRRDIAAIFLGTGLGTPNYAIVQQGMINRFIEAKPEELGLYLEEAAGISYFRKQRQEAESNLRRTAENLDQVRERLSEINRHIAHLENQTRSAVRHRELTQTLRQLRACRHYRDAESIDEKVRALSERVKQRDAELTDSRLSRDALALALDSKRAEHVQTRQLLDQAQEEYYQARNQITGLEKDIERSKDEVGQIGVALENLVRSGEQMRAHLNSDRANVEKLATTLGQSDAHLLSLIDVREQSLQAYQALETELAQVRQRYHDAQNQLRATGQQQEFDSARADSLDEDIKAGQQKCKQLEEQLRELTQDELQRELDSLSKEHDAARLALGEHEQQWQAQQQQAQKTQQEWRERTHELELLREQYQELVHQLSNLRALQEADFGQDPGDSLNWLQQSPWHKCQRLRSLLKVSPGWELAAELILSRLLNAVYTETDLRELKEIPKFGDGELILLLKPESSNANAAGSDLISVREYIRGPAEIEVLLESIYVAENLKQAIEIVRASAPGTSVVLPEGVWLSHNWIRVLHKSDNSNHIIVREQKIKKLEHDQENAEQQQLALKKKIDQLSKQREHQLEQAGQFQEDISQMQAKLAQLAVQVVTARNRVEQNQQRFNELSEALASTKAEIEVLTNEQEECLSAREQLTEESSRFQQNLDKLKEQEAQLIEQHTHAHEDYLSHRDRLQSAQLAKTHDHQEHEKLNSGIDRLAGQLEQNQLQSDQLQLRRSELATHIKNCQEKHSESLDKRAEIEKQRKVLEIDLKELNEQIEKDTHKLNTTSRELEEKTAEMSEWRIELSHFRTQMEHVKQSLVELNLEEGFAVSEEIQALDDDEIEHRLQRSARRLEKIGPVNLVAESEHREQRERADHLNGQVEDLEKSSASLRGTMDKMDAQIKHKYLKTFAIINENLKLLFARMFPGGDAYLKESPNDDDTGNNNPGVVFMAQPPGKRIVRIQQLSGGERTLSAIALMFAFFKLNPAPFCLLDEVDAPLDDINVHRYCSLLAEMSDEAQFIIITHNKITMSRMHVLHGVTMPSAGISRIVDVDLKTAQQVAG